MGHSVLIVENEKKWRLLFEEGLRAKGYSVESSKSWENAVETLESNGGFDALVLNLHFLSRRDYLAQNVLESVVRCCPQTPCIIVSGYPDQLIKNVGRYRDQVFELLWKGDDPQEFDLDVLFGTVESAIRQRSPQTKPRHITWLHISDLHLHPPDYGAHIVLKNLLRDVEEQMNSQSLKPDFIVVTGDTAHTGKARQYERAEGFLEKLRVLTGLSKSRLFIVPGNHDIDWVLIDDAFAAACSKALVSKDAVDEMLDKPGELRRILKKFRHYKRFVNTYLANSAGNPLRPCDYNHLYFTETMNLANLPVSILGLNSAWMSAYKWKPKKKKKDAVDRHNLLLGRRQLRDALAEVEPRVKKDEPHLVIAIMHHPTEWLKDGIDREEVEALLEERCAFVLRGHLHDNKVVQFQTPGGEAVTITAGASFKTRGGKLDYNGYNFVRLDLDKGEGTIYLRAYSQKGSEFWTDDVFSYPKTDGGRVSFKLPDFSSK